ncbi:ROK family transcriptional regulator [Nonomuraea glycinis]|uniref:Sugar kinase n=1 Tax=Nonomuraea glycinis TaxID=2047744 RepID=A0A918AFE3_9ACTN|nr:ROK family protein [Nonomuraea glycinis]MCA2179571.1 ROK family transcriptional regulator [Nonomuraea glycinis]GGP15376.1 sugar kinase [Nonomuraea glycinis]
MIANGARTSGELRAHNRVRLLRAVHDCGATWTRSRLTRELELARGTASVLVGGLVEDGLLHEVPAPEQVRGRPTLVPGPHPDGPIVLAVDVREDAWELAACELGGRITVLGVQEHDGTPEGVFLPLGEAIRDHLARYGTRVVGVGVAVAGPVREGDLVDIAHLRWRSVDVPALLAVHRPGSERPGSDRPGFVRVGNDTALAGLAEARRGLLRGVQVGLHLHVDFDLGGVLIVDGRPLGGASGIGAEFGHMPLTGGDAPCMCGASGCWGMEVGANALLRHMGLAYGGGKGRAQAAHLLAQAATKAASPPDGGPADRTTADQAEAAVQAEAAMQAVAANARALGRGIAALVNAHDPEVVVLSGLAADLYERVAPVLTGAVEDGLMTIRRDRPPLIAPSAMPWRGSLLGAMESVFDAFLTPEGLATWLSTPK